MHTTTIPAAFLTFEEIQTRGIDIPDRFARKPVRKLTTDERDLITHISMWGSTGYPINRIGGRWSWSYRSISHPSMFKSKKAAIESFEAFHELLLDCHAFASWQRAIIESGRIA